MQEKSNEQAVPTGQSAGTQQSQRRQRTMLVRYGKMGYIGQFRHSERAIPPGITHVVAKTERGLELAEIVSPFCHDRGYCSLSDEKVNSYLRQSGPDYPFTRHGTIVRFATEQDINEQKHLNNNVRVVMDFCRKRIEKFNLAMRLTDAEHLFGGERIIFYFMADGRVDFRELVKELAHQYQTRIEMRQVGARDEARLIADFETCGRECCCKNFLKVLQPVNMRMAKLQKATLDPSKISGRCGRLKCCLRYEDKVYDELFKCLPHKGSCVLTEKGPGIVIDTQVLTQLIKVRLDKTDRVIAISSDEILERGYVRSEPVADKAIESKPREPLSDKKPTSSPDNVDTQNDTDRESGEQMASEQESANPKKRRRRRRKKNNPSDQGPQAGQTQA